MERLIVAAMTLLSLVAAPSVHSAERWVEGENYVVMKQPQRTTVAQGKVEVLEVFSYGCIACNSFQPSVEKLKSSLPAKVQMSFLHASFNSSESWPIFQRAFLAAQSLGIADRTHQAMFDAIWKTGELAVIDTATRRLKSPQPTLEGIARFYERLAGVKADAFLAAARSFSVEAKMKAADAQIAAMQVPGTPSIVVNGKYRVEMGSLASIEELIELVQYLVAKESTLPRAAG